jgi:hypothetical protein
MIGANLTETSSESRRYSREKLRNVTERKSISMAKKQNFQQVEETFPP